MMHKSNSSGRLQTKSRRESADPRLKDWWQGELNAAKNQVAAWKAEKGGERVGEKGGEKGDKGNEKGAQKKAEEQAKEKANKDIKVKVYVGEDAFDDDGDDDDAGAGASSSEGRVVRS